MQIHRPKEYEQGSDAESINEGFVASSASCASSFAASFVSHCFISRTADGVRSHEAQDGFRREREGEKKLRFESEALERKETIEAEERRELRERELKKEAIERQEKAEALEKKKRQEAEALEKKERQEAIETQKRAVALEKKEKQEAIERQEKADALQRKLRI